MERYDIAIIGTGPAGLEAALTAKLRNKRILLLGSKALSPKVEVAHTVQNYLGLPQISGDQMQKVFLDHLTQMEIQITEDQANAVYAMESYFVIQGHHDMYEASTVILACGVATARPLPGELENLGRGVSYCATCDAALYRGKSAVVVGYNKEAEKEAEFLGEIAHQVLYIPMYSGPGLQGNAIQVVEHVVPVGIEKSDTGIRLKLEDRELATDGIFLLRENILPSQLVPGIKIEGNRVIVNRKMETNLPGLFACGDLTGAPYQYIKAAGEGNVAALSAVDYLARQRKPE